MLKKMYQLNIKIVVVILLSLVLLQLVTGYVFGFITQTQMDLQFKHLTSSPLIQVKQREYRRGIFSSDATTEVSINSQVLSTVLSVLPKAEAESLSNSVANNYSIKYTTHVEHGIFAGLLNGYFMPTLAYSRTNIIYPEKMKNVLNKFFNNQPPLVVDNVIYIDKSGRYQVYSPKFDYSEAVSGVKVLWGGMDLVVKYNEDFNKFKTKLSVPIFELTAPTKGSVTVKDLVYQSDSRNSVNQIKVGDTKLSLSSIKVDWKDKIALNFKMGDVLHMLTGISSAEFLNEIDAINPNSFLLTNVNYTSISHDEDGFFAATANADFESLITNGKSYGPMDLNISIDHVASVPFSQLMDKIAEISNANESNSSNQDKNQERLIKTLKQYFGPILVEKPIIKLNSFNLVTPDGLVKISGYATTESFVLSDMNDQQKFMRKLALDINLSVPKPILSYLFVLQMRYLLSAGNAQLDTQSADALTKVVNILLDNQINIWMKKGYLTTANDALATHMYIKNGKLYFNDKAASEW